ncbi:MAG: toll/interleukin-1 receptor domain-containing protein [Sphingobacteriales bacterium]|nr:MAG: toll/interleukin-1 receptor domain-containing protein [Sphingobacteriales bacterium]
MAINRAETKTYPYTISQSIKENKPCIFISHQKRDSPECKKIVEYIIKADLDVYFDEEDEHLADFRRNHNPSGVINSIRHGIDSSTHMLCVISKNTLASKWVPFEVGYGYDKTRLAVLTLKGITDTELPDYIKAAPLLLRGTQSVNKYVASIKGNSVENLVTEHRLFSHYQMSHPLDLVLDWDK